VRQLQAHPLPRGGAGLNGGAGASGAGERLAAIRQRIAAACGRAGRDPAAVTLVGASKTQPAAVLAPFVAAGLSVLGENRVQEAQAKQRQLAEIPRLPPVEWHLIGPLQTNKARPALDLFTCIHALDRPAIAAAVDREAARRGAVCSGFVEVNLGEEPTKHGFPPGGLAAALQPLAGLGNLRIVGLMAIPPLAAAEVEAEAARGWFRRLRELRDELASRPEWAGWPGWLSMGMSDDFELAIEEGATHVRIGTALFGPRATQPLSMLG
jgi:pyridoxal phosphate enzyme (YggS family)